MSSWEFHSLHRRSEINVSEQNPVASYLDTRYPWFAKKLRPACMQHDGYLKAFLKVIPPMSEDCLYLNIFYPNRTHEDPTIRYPVVIHIHGGSYVCGSNHLYPGHVLASMGVVFVSISYRLGPFDLFHQVIMMSGSDLSCWAVTDPNRVRSRYYAIELGRALGCSSVLGDRVAASQAAMRGEQWKPSGAADVPEGQFGNGSAKPRLAIPFTARIDASALLRCLRHKSTAEEIANNSLLTPLDGAPNFVWSPVVDGTSGFLPRVPLEERKQGRFDALPLLAGVTHDEGSQVLLSNLARWEERRFRIKDFTDAVVRRTIGNFLNSEKVFRFQTTAEELYTRYTWWPNMANNSARWENMVALISDYVINTPLDTVLRFHASSNPKTYFYEFAYLSPNDTLRTPERGVYHGAEQPFLFGFPFLDVEFWQRYFGGTDLPRLANRTYFYPHDTNVSEWVMQADPTPQPIKNVTWPVFKRPWDGYLFISLNSTPKFHFRPGQMAFWRERFFRLAEPLSPSPPIYYFPLFDAQLATVVLGLLLSVVISLVVVVIVLLNRRPRPEQFRHSVRLAPPGAAPGSAFQTAFEDAFTTRSIMSPLSSQYVTQSDPYTPTTTRNGSINGLQERGSNCQLSLGGVPSIRRVHPPPPPPPAHNRRVCRQRDSRGATELEDYSLESLPMFCQAVDI
ncbi:hypothetical protein D915_006009 [Fasciola hepatica]|uniref:Carboxylesterase type B domain-containing protein n=1 Tax=Fasciola hepatica TaxID=6192 RepID=A0A4E0S092_FASHE|nr:hypothetical protein D915_006009 [Fasciola hepatica]